MTDYHLHAGSIGGTVLAGCAGLGSSLQLDPHKPDGAGRVFHQTIGIKRVASKFALTTTGLKSLLSLLTITNQAVPWIDFSSQALALWSAKSNDLSPGYVSGANHERITLAIGAGFLESIAWSRQGESAQAVLGCFALSSDGDAEPWTPAVAALPTVPADEEMELVGLTIGGIEILGAASLRIATGIAPQYFWKTGKKHPTRLRHAGTLEPMMQVACEDRTTQRAWRSSFAGGADVSAVATFAKMSHAQTGHTSDTVTATLNGVARWVDGQDGRPSGVNLEVIGRSTDGLTAPLTWATA